MEIFGVVIQTLVVLVLGIFPIGFLLVDFVAGRFDALSRDRFNRFFLALFLGLHWCLVWFLALVYGDFSREVCFWAIGFKTALDLGLALWLVARVVRGECLREGWRIIDWFLLVGLGSAIFFGFAGIVAFPFAEDNAALFWLSTRVMGTDIDLVHSQASPFRAKAKSRKPPRDTVLKPPQILPPGSPILPTTTSRSRNLGFPFHLCRSRARKTPAVEPFPSASLYPT